MTTFTTRYGFPQIVEATDLVNVATDFNTPWATLDTLLGSQVCTSTTRPASPIQGQLIFETNTGIVRIWTGTAWENTGTVACLSSAFPANPIAGDTVYTTDKNAMASYTGSAWKFTTTVVCTSTTRPAVALASGVSIWETDTLAYAEYSGSAWRYTTNLTCTSSTRPTGSNTALVNGTLATETDTDRLIQWTGSAWKQLNTIICTSTTHPANPLTGGQIYETDTTAEGIYSGTAYLYDAQQIGTILLASSAANMTFTGIPPYNHLFILYNGRQDTGAAGAYATLQINGDTASHYTYQNLVGNVSSVSTSNAGGLTTSIRMGVIACSGDTASYFGNGLITMSNIQSTTPFKSVMCSYACAVSAANGFVGVTGGLWDSTAAVTSIKLLPGAGNFVAGSSMSVYGCM